MSMVALPYLKLIVLLSILSYPMINSDNEEVQTIEIDVNGKTIKREILKVSFENDSGKPVELWSDTQENVFFKGVLQDKEKITIDTYVGDRVYFTPINSGGSHEKQFYSTYIKKRDVSRGITLKDKTKMKDYIKEKDVGCDMETRKCDVIFQNNSGKKLKVFWDDGKNGLFQGALSVNNEMTMHTHIGHTFFCTSYDNDKDNNKNKKRLFSYKITKNSKIVNINKLNE